MIEKPALELTGDAKHAAGRGSEGPSSPSSRAAAPAAVIVVILLLLMPLLYGLSIGPVVWLESRDFIEVDDNSYVVLFYVPLIYLVDSSNALEAGFIWYVELWEKKTPPPVFPPGTSP